MVDNKRCINKQEEIREGLDIILTNFGHVKKSLLDAEDLCYLKSEIFTYLHSVDVVIKVEKELPDLSIKHCPSAHSETCKTCDNCEIYWFAAFDLCEAGYATFEPLIKE